MRLARDLIRSFVGVGAMYALSIPLGLLTTMVLTRNLAVDQFGQYAFMMTIASLLLLPVAGGLPQLLTREVARYAHAQDWPLLRGVIRGSHLWVLFTSALILAAYGLAGPMFGWLPCEGRWRLLGLGVLLVPLHGINAVRNGTIKGFGYPAIAELSGQTIQPILLLSGVALLARMGELSASHAMWSQVLAALVALIVASVVLLRVRPPAAVGCVPRYQTAAWLRHLQSFSLISLAASGSAQVGVLLLGALGTDEHVAVFRVAERGAQLALVSLTLVNMVISPHIVRAVSSQDLSLLQKLSRKSARGAFVFGLLIALVLIGMGQPIIGLLFGSVYEQASYSPMTILLVGYVLHLMAGPSGILLTMSGFPQLCLSSMLLGLLVTLASGVPLIVGWGANGAACAVAGGVVTYTALQALHVHRKLGIRPGVV